MTTCNRSHSAPTCADPACFREEHARKADEALPGLGDLVRKGRLDPGLPTSAKLGDADDGSWTDRAEVIQRSEDVRSWVVAASPFAGWGTTGTTAKGLSTDPFSLDELIELEKRLDDETEWETIDEFWQAWGPRLNNRIRRLLTAALKVARDDKGLRPLDRKETVMRTIPPEDFPPLGALVIERDDRRAVLLHEARMEKLELAVWLRGIANVHPTVLGGWYCVPDAGLVLTRESARALLLALTEALR